MNDEGTNLARRSERAGRGNGHDRGAPVDAERALLLGRIAAEERALGNALGELRRAARAKTDLGRLASRRLPLVVVTAFGIGFWLGVRHRRDPRGPGSGTIGGARPGLRGW